MITEWISVITKKPVTLREFERSKVCKDCDHRTYSKYLELIKGKIEDIQGHYCDDCGCPLVAKVKSNKKIDICDKWEN